MPNRLSPSTIILLTVVIVLLLIIVIGASILIITRIRKNKNQSLKAIDDFRLQPLVKEIEKYKKLQNKYKKKLTNQEYFDHDQSLKDMKTILHDELEDYKNQQLIKIDQDVLKHKNELLKHVLLSSMQPLHLKVINESSLHFLPISERNKPLLIGKKGANIKFLNEITNCNISVERNNPYVEISCPNPLDKQIAINTINHLIKSQAFDLNAIENVYKKEKRLMNKECIETGKKYLGILNIKVDNPEIYEYVGRLKYRWSFNQNVLQHSYEVALICESLANQLGLDPQIAKEVGFFHDVGKSIDYERRYDHIDTGIKIAKKCDLSHEVINTILKHHRTNCNEDYVLLVRCADAWSAARKGARHVPTDNEEATIKIVSAKIKKLNEVVSFKVNVNKNNIEIIFVPLVPDKKHYLATRYRIIRLIKDDVRLNKYTIQIHD